MHLTLITLSTLIKAIENALEIGYQEAERYASIVMDFFGFEDQIVDNVLSAEERQLFYRLQAKGLITTEREETVLPSGSPWRIHYWRFVKETIVRYAGMKMLKTPFDRVEKVIQRSPYEDVYSTVPKELWVARKTPADI